MSDAFKKVILWMSIFCIIILIISSLIDGDCGHITRSSDPLARLSIELSGWRCKFVSALDKIYNVLSGIILVFYVVWYFLFGKEEN